MKGSAEGSAVASGIGASTAAGSPAEGGSCATSVAGSCCVATSAAGASCLPGTDSAGGGVGAGTARNGLTGSVAGWNAGAALSGAGAGGASTAGVSGTGAGKGGAGEGAAGGGSTTGAALKTAASSASGGASSRKGLGSGASSTGAACSAAGGGTGSAGGGSALGAASLGGGAADGTVCTRLCITCTAPLLACRSGREMLALPTVTEPARSRGRPAGAGWGKSGKVESSCCSLDRLVAAVSAGRDLAGCLRRLTVLCGDQCLPAAEHRQEGAPLSGGAIAGCHHGGRWSGRACAAVGGSQALEVSHQQAARSQVIQQQLLHGGRDGPAGARRAAAGDGRRLVGRQQLPQPAGEQRGGEGGIGGRKHCRQGRKEKRLLVIETAGTVRPWSGLC